MSYEIDGRQFIVIAAGGHGQLGTKRGAYVVAFALRGSGLGSESEKSAAFRKALAELEARIELFVNLPISTLDRMTLQHELRAIGRNQAKDKTI